MQQTNESIDFVHLHLHTEYSLLDGAVKVKELAKEVAKLNMSAVAITDHGVMYGAVPFYRACQQAGIKPIIGCEVYIAPQSRFDKDKQAGDTSHHLVLLVANEVGYENLLQLVSAASIEGFYYKPRIDKQLLKQHSEGLIALSACLAGELPRMLLHNNEQAALQVVNEYINIFSKDNYYIELQDHKIPEQKIVNQKLVALAKQVGIGVVATNDVHYIKAGDAIYHDKLLCIQTGKTLADEGRMKFPTEEFYLKTAAEMEQLFAWIPEAIINTKRIADKCNFELDFSGRHLPHFEVPVGYTHASYLRELCNRGLFERYGLEADEDIYRNRLDYELQVINDMGFDSYFLIVQDFMRYAHENDILTGPGRGSAAGSIVAYVLRITNIDPIKYKLLFERFLNPNRISMPDIDIDFDYERRAEVIQYVVDKYGADKVAQIITFGTMAARAAIRDAGRVMNMAYGDVDKVAKMVPETLGITLEKALETSNDLREHYEQNEQVKQLLDAAIAIEGMPRHASTHAAGVVISKERLTRYVPLQKGTEDAIVTQYSMEILESIGLLKMDFLGLRTLTVINNTLKNIFERTAKEININQVAYDDESTYTMLSLGNTSGVFQLESVGMRNVLRELKPSNFEDIVAVLALYRPGPMENIPTYIKSKHGIIKPKYPHPDLEHILKDTYGIIVYQEQIMQIASEMAGFSLGQADLLRRAVSKKKREVLDEQRDIFVKGCIDTGFTEKTAHEVYDTIVAFANYGFNRSHAAAYAVIAWQTAWLKANHQLEFMAAVLTGAMTDSNKVAQYIDDTKKMGIKVLPPDINESIDKFTVAGDSIRFGLEAIKGVGKNVIQEIIRERGTKPFSSLFDFCERMAAAGTVCKRNLLENLIKCGAFLKFGSRAQCLAGLDVALDYGMNRYREKNDAQINLFGVLEEKGIEEKYPELPIVPEFSEDIILEMERELTGIYMSGHPLDKYNSLHEKYNITRVSELSDATEDSSHNLLAILQKKQQIMTKKGQLMAFLVVEDLTDTVEVVVFPETYSRAMSTINSDKPLLIRGRLQIQDNNYKIIATDIRLASLEPERTLFIKYDYQNNKDDFTELLKVFEKHQGETPVVIYDEQNKQYRKLQENYYVKESQDLKYDLSKYLSEDRIIIK